MLLPRLRSRVRSVFGRRVCLLLRAAGLFTSSALFSPPQRLGIGLADRIEVLLVVRNDQVNRCLWGIKRDRRLPRLVGHRSIKC